MEAEERIRKLQEEKRRLEAEEQTQKHEEEEKAKKAAGEQAKKREEEDKAKKAAEEQAKLRNPLRQYGIQVREGAPRPTVIASRRGVQSASLDARALLHQETKLKQRTCFTNICLTYWELLNSLSI